jgi:hypothetical protein
MDTYTCNETGPRAFEGFVARAIAKLGADNYGAAISSVNTTITQPGQPAPNQCIGGWLTPPAVELLRARFRFLAQQGVQAIALLQGSPDPENITGMYMPLMKEFIAGGMFEAKTEGRSGRPGL